jgi:hypothetical protein
LILGIRQSIAKLLYTYRIRLANDQYPVARIKQLCEYDNAQVDIFRGNVVRGWKHDRPVPFTGGFGSKGPQDSVCQRRWLATSWYPAGAL